MGWWGIVLIGALSAQRAIGNSGIGNRKQKIEMENGTGQILMYM